MSLRPRVGKMQGEMRHGRLNLAAVLAVVSTLTIAVTAVAQAAAPRARMSGGGSVLVGKTRVAHTLSLDCRTAAAHQRLRVRWGSRTFRLAALTDSFCADDGHTYFGEGTGRLDGRDGFTAYWRVVDARDADRLRLEIRDADGKLVLDVGERVLRDGAVRVRRP